MSSSAAPVAKEHQLTLTTSDNATVSVDREVAERSILIKNLLEDIGESDEPIPIPNVCARHHLAYYRVSADSA
jgi:S-phase kinase-associated protein 1